MGTCENQPDQDAVVLALADSKSRLDKTGIHKDQLDQDFAVLVLAGLRSRLD